MRAWLLWWFVVSIVALGALGAICVGLFKRLMVLGRALQRFQDEVRPAAEEISRGGARAAARAGGERPSPRA
ncbi:MAG: hypothetical protein HY240_05755 [Actinobacteria bacterium]|nr:hypothetical protein [Actinomycetota bacterium]